MIAYIEKKKKVSLKRLLKSKSSYLLIALLKILVLIVKQGYLNTPVSKFGHIVKLVIRLLIRWQKWNS